MILEVGKHYQIDNLTKCFADVSIERDYEFKVSKPLLLKTNGSKPITSFNRVKLIIGSNGGIATKVWGFYKDQTLVDSILFVTVAQRKDNIAFFSFTVEEILSVGDIEIDVAIHELNASMIRDISNPSHCTLNPTPQFDQVLSSGFYRFNVEDGYTLVNVTLHPQGTILASIMPIGWTENLVMNLDDHIQGIGRNMGLLTPYGFSGDISFTNGAVPVTYVTISWDTDGLGYEVVGYDYPADYETVTVGGSLELTLKPLDNFYFTEESAYLLKEANKDCPFDFDAKVNDNGYIEISMSRIREDYEVDTPDKEDLNVKELPKLTGVIGGGSIDTEPELVDDYIPYGSELTITFAPNRQHIGGDLIVNKLTMGGIDISNLLENESITIPRVTGDIEYDVNFLREIDVDFYNKNGGIEFTYTGRRKFELEIRKVLDAISFYIDGVLVYSYTEELAQNEKIVGFGSQDGELQIPLNTIVYFFSYSSKSYYPIIEEDEPTTTDFSMELFQMKGEKNLVDKTKVLTSISTISGTLRESCSMTRPVVTCEFSDVPKFNYVYIPSMRRFYFVTEITFVTKNIYEVSLRVDVLMSYRNQIKSLKGIVARNEFDFNNLVEDNNRSIEKTKSVEILYGERASSPFSNDGSGVFVLQVVGGTGVFDK